MFYNDFYQGSSHIKIFKLPHLTITGWSFRSVSGLLCPPPNWCLQMPSDGPLLMLCTKTVLSHTHRIVLCNFHQWTIPRKCTILVLYYRDKIFPKPCQSPCDLTVKNGSSPAITIEMDPLPIKFGFSIIKLS